MVQAKQIDTFIDRQVGLGRQVDSQIDKYLDRLMKDKQELRHNPGFIDKLVQFITLMFSLSINQT